MECALVVAGLSREVMVSSERLSMCGGGCIIHNVLEDPIAFCAQVAWYTNVYICMYTYICRQVRVIYTYIAC